ncbi:MAG TPA: class I SAM-dependent methyltransferase, partial [Gemmatimonadaceae bacterium]|nr:class I SAM-dependent methyltransferase [Gemmatimonadaceae bacterium]
QAAAQIQKVIPDSASPLRPPERGDAAAEIARAYDRWATRYDVDDNRTRDLDARVLRESDLAVNGRDVLELGCGTAKNTVWLAERARRVVGLDFSRGMLEVARSRLATGNVELIEHDVQTRWPVSDGEFDLVVADLILEHLENVTPVFAEAARVLRPGGTMFMCELHPYRQWRGGQAHFTDEWSGETIFAPAYAHSIAEYVNAGIGAGLELRRLDEWMDEEAHGPADTAREAVRRLPRLVSIRFDKPRP